MFGMRSAVGHQAVNGLVEGYRCGEKLYADKIPFTFGVATQVTNARIRNRRLPVERQAHGLNRLDGQRLMGFDQRAMMREIVHADRIAGVERSPERAEHFETHAGSSITCRFHAHPSIRRHASAIGSPRHGNAKP